MSFIQKAQPFYTGGILEVSKQTTHVRPHSEAAEPKSLGHYTFNWHFYFSAWEQNPGPWHARECSIAKPNP